MPRFAPTLIAIVALAAGNAFAQSRPSTAPKAPESRFALTIYSTADPATFDPQQLAQQQLMNPYGGQVKLPGYGVVREVRPIDLTEGENIVRFTDVASGIDPTTVAFQSLTAPDSTSVLEQSYEYDVVSAAKLLDKYIGKAVVVVRKTIGDAQAQPSDNLQGILLSSDASNIVVQNENGDTSVISRAGIDSLRLAKLQTGLITKPTLVWTVQAKQAGKHNAQVTYQTDGLTWRADYNVMVNKDDTAADIGAWVSILNQSGASYPDARLKLVAGDVQRIERPQPSYGARAMMQAAAKVAGTGGFEEKSFFEYHLYTLGRTTSLSNSSTKQIELFPAKVNVPVKKIYVYYGLDPQFRMFIPPEPNPDRTLGTQSNKKVDVYLEVKNSEANGLGIPLPAGRLRVYKKDEADAASEFIGEDVIQHTPKDETVRIKLGSAFDVVGERKQTDFNGNLNGHIITEAFEITIRNHKKDPVHVIIKENLFRWTNWEIIRSSDKYEKVDSRTIHIPVDVPADGSKTVTYSVKYSW